MSESARTVQRRVLDTIQRLRLWTPDQTVCVAVSGGLDSTALLHLLHRTQGAHRGRLVVCSINHGLRPESTEEVKKVGLVAAELGVPFRSFDLELTPGPNLAERARDARRVALRSLATDKVATGHHQDDQAETVLYHLLRGSGQRGLCGMQASRGPWVRPLLFESRQTLKDWATAHDLSWVDDPSNPASQRGALRRLMPTLDSIHGGSSRALARTARLLAREDDFLERMTEDHWNELYSDGGIDRVGLSLIHPAIQLRVLRRLVDGRSVRAECLESVIAGALMHAGSMDLGAGVSLRCENGRLRVDP